MIERLFVLHHTDGTRTLCTGSLHENAPYLPILHIDTKYRTSLNIVGRWTTGRDLNYISKYLEAYKITLTELLFHEMDSIRKIARDVLDHPLRP